MCHSKDLLMFTAVVRCFPNIPFFWIDVFNADLKRMRFWLLICQIGSSVSHRHAVSPCKFSAMRTHVGLVAMEMFRSSG